MTVLNDAAADIIISAFFIVIWMRNTSKKYEREKRGDIRESRLSRFHDRFSYQAARCPSTSFFIRTTSPIFARMWNNLKRYSARKKIKNISYLNTIFEKNHIHILYYNLLILFIILYFRNILLSYIFSSSLLNIKSLKFLRQAKITAKFGWHFANGNSADFRIRTKTNFS